jgi:hypothetical protein
MDTIKLRTLTWKSVIWWGKYEGLSIRQIFDLKHTGWLRFIYYNNSEITFIDEILEKIRVFGETFDHKINKPGKDPEKGQEVSKWCFLKYGDKFGFAHADNLFKIPDKIQHKKTIQYEKIAFSKGNLQRMNQGHGFRRLF